MMSKRITCLSESPCYKCGVWDKCNSKVRKAPKLQEIIDFVMPQADFDYRECGIWIALNAREVVE